MMNLKVILISVVLVILGGGAFFFIQTRNVPSLLTSNPLSNGSEISWSFDGTTWQASSPPPPCPEPLVFASPVDLNLASGILYPGQIRGDYKPHGGFRFDNRDTNDVEVRAIMDGYILKAARYDDGGEIQNFMFYVNDCGIMVMHDHLLTLNPKLQEVFDKLPIGQNGDSRTTNIEPKVYLKKGEVLATEIGYKNFEGKKNISVDFGMYDFRKSNGVTYNETFRANNPNINEYGAYAVCWFDYLPPEDEQVVRSLPAGGNEGKASDYCN